MEDREPEISRLLRRWHAGDTDALTVILQRYLPAIRAHVHRRLGPLLRKAGDTGDYVQDALLEILRYGPRFAVSDEKHFRLLLGRIVENVLRETNDRFTTRRRELAREALPATDSVLALDPAVASQTSPSDAVDRRQHEAWIRLGLELLEPEDREVIVLREWDDLSFAEIAGLLGIAEGTARMRHHRALARLADQVGSLRRGKIDSLFEEES